MMHQVGPGRISSLNGKKLKHVSVQEIRSKDTARSVVCSNKILGATATIKNHSHVELKKSIQSRVVLPVAMRL